MDLELLEVPKNLLSQDFFVERNTQSSQWRIIKNSNKSEGTLGARQTNLYVRCHLEFLVNTDNRNDQE